MRVLYEYEDSLWAMFSQKFVQICSKATVFAQLRAKILELRTTLESIK